MDVALIALWVTIDSQRDAGLERVSRYKQQLMKASWLEPTVRGVMQVTVRATKNQMRGAKLALGQDAASASVPD